MPIRRFRPVLIHILESRLLLSATYPLTAIPALNGDPGAPMALYLDFHGEPSEYWGLQIIPAIPAYDIDGDPSFFSAQELTNIQNIWAAVSEAYSPFNINVTTVDPGNWDLEGLGIGGGNPPRNQFRIVIGGNSSWSNAYDGGVAYVGSYAQHNLPNTAYVFPANLANGNPTYTADNAAHEAGHAFGLNEQSVYNGTTLVSEYNTGNGVTAPFMGNPLAPGIRATWWDGPSDQGYNVIQDDMAVIANSTNGFGYRPLTHGQSTATASALSLSNNSFSASGIIENTTQQDYFTFTAPAAGTDSVAVNVASFDPTLHAQLLLLNSSGTVIASADNSATLGQSLTANLAAGSYYLVVKSFGQYGDVGQYTLTGTLAPAVIGRYLFYNNSIFDGHDPTLGPTDDHAIAPDKQALLPGSTAQGVNVSSYSRGIDGLMIDIANLPATPTLADFTFAVGNTAQIGQWTSATAPNAMLVRPGAGTAGSTRIEFNWVDGAIKNEWLAVTVNADADTGLATPDVFYFGNLVGASVLSPQAGQFSVTAADLAAVRNDPHGFLSPAPITDPNDFNRDGLVDATDQLITRNQVALAIQLLVLAPPLTTPSALMSEKNTSTTADAIGSEPGSASDPLAPDTDSGKPAHRPRSPHGTRLTTGLL